MRVWTAGILISCVLDAIWVTPHNHPWFGLSVVGVLAVGILLLEEEGTA